MTEENNNISTESEQSIDNSIKAETLFVVIKDVDGNFRAVSELSQKVDFKRPPSLNDVRVGCQEILRSIEIRNTAEAVVGLINSVQAQKAE